MRYTLIAVEGWGDVEFVLASLRLLKIDRAMEKTGPDAGFWQPLLPTSLPQDKDLWDRLQIPYIAESDDVSVAVRSMGGKSKLADFNTLLFDKDVLISELSAFGVVVDADSDSMQGCVKNVCDELSHTPAPLPAKAGDVLEGEVYTGIYVMPNNTYSTDSLALERVIRQSGEVIYPELLKSSEGYVNDNIDKYHKKVSESLRDKAIVNSATSILQPKYSTNVSLKLDDWVSPKAYMEAAMVRQFVDFLADLLDVPRFQPQVAPTHNPTPPSAAP